MKSLVGSTVEKISQNAELVKSIKAEGRQQPKLKRLPGSETRSIASQSKISSASAEPCIKIRSRTLSLMDTHSFSDFGYAYMTGATLSNTDWHSLQSFLQKSAAKG